MIIKFLKILALGVVFFTTILLIFAAFLRNSYTVESEVIVFRPRQVCFEYISLLKNQERYSRWSLMDSNLKHSHYGVDGTVGFVSAWSSDLDYVGEGQQEITNIRLDTAIEYKWRHCYPFLSEDSSYIIIEDLDAEVTKITWGFKGHLPFPLNLLIVFNNLDWVMANDLGLGLERLKQDLENSAF